jgi:hypothetical protein
MANQRHLRLDVTFNQDQSRLRKGHGSRNMAVVRHFAFNLVRQAVETPPAFAQAGRAAAQIQEAQGCQATRQYQAPAQIADWDTHRLATVRQMNP